MRGRDGAVGPAARSVMRRCDGVGRRMCASRFSTVTASLAVVVLFASGCIRRPADEPVAVRIWPDALGDARRAVAAGSYPAADSSLARFARSYEGTEEARESLFLLALFRLDPGNRGASARDAVRAFDAYLALPGASPRAEEARALRRLAVRLDSLGQAPARPATPTRDEEMQKLRDELARANDELERIKRRLAQPRP